MDAQAFLKALLMGRIIPLHNNSVEFQQRISDLRQLLELFQKIPAPLSDTPLEVNLEPILQGFTGLQSGSRFEDAQKKYDEALELLMKGLELDRGDQKKWPHLNSEEKAIRVLTNYFASSPNRFALERPFRKYHVAYHLKKAEEDLAQNKLPETEQDLLSAQEELRHVIALSVGVDLRELRDEAETLSQTSGQAERVVTLSLFDRFLKTDLPQCQLIYPALQKILDDNKVSNLFVNPLKEKIYPAKEISNIADIEELLVALKSQAQNITLKLKSGTKIDWKLFLNKLLCLPDAFSHCYFRMPDIDRFRNVKIEDADGKMLVFFDEEARLAYAPSVQSLRGEKEENPCLLDVAIVGGGPGGISAAVNLSSLGIFRYAIFERAKPNSTVIDIWSREKEADTFYSGPPGKIEGLVGMQDTTRAVFLSRMNSFIEYFHLNLRNKEQVLAISREENGLWSIETSKAKYHAKTLIMTAGRYGKPRLLKWEEGDLSEDLRKRIVRGVEVDDIENASVLVIGGGNTAFDNVKTLSARGSGKKGNTVYISYPKKPFNVPGSLHVHNNDQLLEWEAEGAIKILWNTNSESIEAIEENGKKRWKISFRPGEEPASLVVDYIAPAVGWQIDKDMMEKVGVVFDKGNPLCDLESGEAYQLNADGNKVVLKGLYLTGDYAVQKSVPTALTTNFHAAKTIAKKL